MAKRQLIWLMLAGMLVAGMVVPTGAQSQVVQVTMGIDGMV